MREFKIVFILYKLMIETAREQIPALFLFVVVRDEQGNRL